MITPEQVRAARALLQIGVRDLAQMAGVAPGTISRFETGKSDLLGASMRKVQQALQTAGVEFIPENGGGAGVRLRDRRK